MDNIEGLVVRRERYLGRITLDRPKALNALTPKMVRGLTTTLMGWATDPQISVIVLDGAGDRAFCAGDDIKSIYESNPSNGNVPARTFWREEYVLDHLIATYPKPIVVLISGIVMGSGVGLAINARFRMVDERANLTMPETGIGLIPGGGGSRFMSRMPGETGTYLALVGCTIDATNMIAGGLADVFVRRRDRARLLDGLDEIVTQGPESFVAVGNVFKECASIPGAASLTDSASIDQLFAGDRVETILERLTADETEWSQRVAQLILDQSPTSLKLTLKALRRADALPDLATTLAMEFRVAYRIAERFDFQEGLRATAIDKDHAPKWQPVRLADIPDEAIEAYFAPLGDDELKL